MQLGDFANALRQMADNADKLSERHDVAQMAALRAEVDTQAAKAQRDSDLIAELRRQVEVMGRSLDGIGRMRKAVLAGDQAAVQILADALLVLDGDCATYTRGSCRNSSRRRSALFTADAWCERCVARDALERAGALTPEAS
jgi:hypothetical protein